jgi:hypothetical protein
MSDLNRKPPAFRHGESQKKMNSMLKKIKNEKSMKIIRTYSVDAELDMLFSKKCHKNKLSKSKVLAYLMRDFINKK